MIKGGKEKLPLKIQAPVYCVGLFSNSMADVASVVLPLWLAGLGTAPVLIGAVIGARHLLPFFLSIHGGALMDRLGARRLTAVSGLISVLAIMMFPLLTWIPSIFAVQMINGFGASMSWIGAQTAFGRFLHGLPLYAGRFSFGLRLGSFIGPPLAGLAWDTFGVWGGCGFLSLWAGGSFCSALMLPNDDGGGSEKRRHFRLGDLVPRLRDYREAVQIAAIPLMSVVLVVTMFRIAASSIQDSFYPVYLKSIGLTATQIGLLVTSSAAVAGLSALLVERACRFMTPVWLLIFSGFGSIIFVAITPLQHSFLPLAVVAALRGICMGVSQPLMLSILADAAGASALGKGAALRTTANRMAAAVTPISMGAIAGMTGLSASFLIMGVILVGLLSVVALFVRAHPQIAAESRY